jgi:hypothetical protein
VELFVVMGTQNRVKSANKAIVGLLGAALLIGETVLVIFAFEWALGKTW